MLGSATKTQKLVQSYHPPAPSLAPRLPQSGPSQLPIHCCLISSHLGPHLQSWCVLLVLGSTAPFPLSIPLLPGQFVIPTFPQLPRASTVGTISSHPALHLQSLGSITTPRESWIPAPPCELSFHFFFQSRSFFFLSMSFSLTVV